MKRSKNQGSRSEDEQNTFHLQNLLNEAQGLLPRQNPNLDPALQSQSTGPSSSRHDRLDQSAGRSEILGDPNSDDHFALDDAENPLQLLARASDLTVPHSTYSQSVALPVSFPSRSGQSRDLDLQTFFGPFRPNLDVGEAIDPVENGLVTSEEVDGLFTL